MTSNEKSTRLQQLIHRRTKYLRCCTRRPRRTRRIMEQAGCEAGFVGTGGVVGTYTGMADVGTST